MKRFLRTIWILFYRGLTLAKKKIVAIKQEVGERVGVLGEGLLEGKGRRLLHSSSVNAEGVAIVNIFQIS